MGMLDGGSWTSDPRRRGDGGGRLIQERRATRSDRLAEATVACPHCDAPVSVGAAPRRVGDPIACPFCGHAGTIRDFLSFALPTRPARVTLRVAFDVR